VILDLSRAEGTDTGKPPGLRRARRAQARTPLDSLGQARSLGARYSGTEWSTPTCTARRACPTGNVGGAPVGHRTHGAGLTPLSSAGSSCNVAHRARGEIRRRWSGGGRDQAKRSTCRSRLMISQPDNPRPGGVRLCF
jgi:hypothetical protein